MPDVFGRTVRALTLTGFSFLIAAPPAAQASTILYQQVVDFPGSGSTRTSYRDQAQSYFRVYDNFTLGQTGLVTDVTWYGSWVDFVNPSNTSPTPNTTSFEIGFWADSTGSPGTSLSLQTFAIGSVNVTSIGPAPSGLAVYQYQVSLTTPFLATGGTQFWMSVFSNSTSQVPLWGWRSGTGGDALTYQYNFSTGGSTLTGPDRGFTLEGTPVPVPEPGSVLLVISGLAGFAIVRRRRLG